MMGFRQMLRGGGGVYPLYATTVVSLLYRLFNKCWKSRRVPNDWCKAVIVPLYKGKVLRQGAPGLRLPQINGAYTDWWLLNLFMDNCLHDFKEHECGLNIDELFVKGFECADDQIILAASACGLQVMVTKMNNSVKKYMYGNKCQQD
ncbi:hypothetical protein EVAR_12343_1 [Eumeta japonica]|uniref:Reverse transcriptase domain-containing protein n=1 Tax=Eumeta variegata TaxID=151549 RepID=A0A4C1X2V1_EUMVA|nr:hypothetical protein EVAR_12343_1 [Eumeta japonica]